MPTMRRKYGDQNVEGENRLASFNALMEDDFNTGGAVAELFELVTQLNRLADQHKLETEGQSVQRRVIRHSSNRVVTWCSIFGRCQSAFKACRIISTLWRLRRRLAAGVLRSRPKMAESVLMMDDEVDDMNRALQTELVETMQQHPLVTEQALYAIIIGYINPETFAAINEKFVTEFVG